MAVITTQSNYSMGQHRGVYSSSSSFDTYRTNINAREGAFFAIKNSEREDSLPFRDPLILLDDKQEFQAGVTYFLRLQINRHAFKDMTYAIKLIDPKDFKDNKYGFYNEKDYQYLKRVTVNSNSSAKENDEGVAVVTVYKTESGTQEKPVIQYFSALSKPKKVNGNESIAMAAVGAFTGVDETNPPFVNLSYTGTPEPIGSFKISLLENSSSLDSAEIVEVLFTPTKNYSAIVVEKERDNSDWTTFFEDGKDSFNGFETSIGSDIKIYSLKNLLKIEENSNAAIVAKPNKISKIGVWGRSNLCLNCNGEEIRIGPRGYYEMSFDETLGLSSFGVLAENESDFPFLIDYEYVLS